MAPPYPSHETGDNTPIRGSRSRNATVDSSIENEFGSVESSPQNETQFLKKYEENLRRCEGAVNGESDSEDSFVEKQADTDESDEETFVTMQEMNESDGDNIEEGASFRDLMVIQKKAETLGQPCSVGVEKLDASSPNNSIGRMSPRSSRELVKKRSSIVEAMPETPAGWTVLASGIASIVLGHELRLQEHLTAPPLVFGQCGLHGDPGSPLKVIHEKLVETPKSILSREIRPSLFIGTRGAVASAASYLLKGPSPTDEHICFRQVITMNFDGTRIALDWELPPQPKTDSASMSVEERKGQIMSKGGIKQPVVLVLHGMNNDSSFGYVRSLMRTFTNHGWVSVGMNFRGCGGVPLATPRPYNGAYTGDIRGVVQHIASRMSPEMPLFLVGNSLGANILTKYLGEEGLSGTLPACVAGGVALGNPLVMQGGLGSPWKEILALGVKKDIVLNWPSLRHMTSPGYRQAIYNVLTARGIGDVDEGLAPIFIRNETTYPFALRIGYENAEAYWADSSSFNYIQHISVPCLQIIAGDDMLTYKSFHRKLAHCVQNPNVMCVETKCGGHLGWQESPPDSNMFGVGTSWADRATLDFFDAIIKTGHIHDDAEEESFDRPAVVNNTVSISPTPVDCNGPKFRSKL